jgi:hypothetical protein
MAKKAIVVSFTCVECGEGNSVRVDIETEDIVRTFGLRRAPVVEIQCEQCRAKNSVKVDA